jgi:hypothetical protein
MAGEVGRHDGHSAAEEAKGAGRHALVLQRQQPGYAATFGLAQQVERLVLAGIDGELPVRGAG